MAWNPGHVAITLGVDLGHVTAKGFLPIWFLRGRGLARGVPSPEERGDELKGRAVGQTHRLGSAFQTRFAEPLVLKRYLRRCP